MSQGGRSEQVGLLRDAIARIEGDGAPLPRFGAAARRQAALGAEGLDRVLRGGLPAGALCEVVAAAPGDAGAASGFALALAARCAPDPGRPPVVWIVEDGARRETGLPYAPGLVAHGLDPARLLIVRTARGADTLWAMEEALKCRALGAVVAELWRTTPYDLVASRRLALAAQANRIPGILVVAGAAGTARRMSSAARLRFEVAAARGAALASAGGRTPLPGRAAWAVRLARIRAGPAADGSASNGFDCDKIWPLVWDHEEALFRDALPLPPSAVPGDRSDPRGGADGRHVA